VHELQKLFLIYLIADYNTGS